MIIYYIVSLIAITALILYAPEHLIFNQGSLCVVFIIALMIFTALHFKKRRENGDSNTAYGSNFNSSEHDNLFRLMYLSFKLYIPLCVPFFFFLIEWKKIAAVCILYFVAFLTGPIMYRIKYGKITKDRLNNEESELKEQKRKETDGKF